MGIMEIYIAGRVHILTSEQQKRIEEFYLEMYDLLLIYARNALENDSLAEEAIQETFRIVCTKPRELLTSPNPRGWLLNTLKYTIQNMKRSRDRANVLLMQYVAAHSESIAFSEDRISLEVSYENVAQTEEFQLIRELAIEGRSHLEMAQARGITVDNCKKRVQRAKEFLRRKI
jgi:RNA polymerase sigma-70 factor (ECF subfamily)